MNNYLTTEILKAVNEFNKQNKYLNDYYDLPDSEWLHELNILNQSYDYISELIKKYQIFNDCIFNISIDSDGFIYNFDIQS